MTVNHLDIDPKNLHYDFHPEWHRFQESRVNKFLCLWLERRVWKLRNELESAQGADVVGLQREIRATRALKTLLESESVENNLNEVVQFLQDTQTEK